MLEKTEKSRMDILEKLATLDTKVTRRRQIKQIHNTICVGGHYVENQQK